MTLSAAGTDPVFSVLLFWFLAMLKYPDAQKRAQRELDAVVGRRGQEGVVDGPHLERGDSASAVRTRRPHPGTECAPALVPTKVAQVGVVVHREVADRVCADVRISLDRLLARLTVLFR